MAKVAKKKSEVYKFFIILGIFVAYMIFSVLHFGLSSGILVSVLSWSFFVFCTPIADAGFLLDFPIRLLTGIRMLYTELMVWAFAIAVNLLAVLISPEVYEKTALLHLFKQIITTPWPLGLIVLLSAVGTYISVYLGDDALDIASSKNKKTNFIDGNEIAELNSKLVNFCSLHYLPAFDLMLLSFFSLFSKC